MCIRDRNNPIHVTNLLTKDFNVRETSSEAFLTFEQLNNTATFDIEALKPRYGIGGIDLSATTDLTCATLLFMAVSYTHLDVYKRQALKRLLMTF